MASPSASSVPDLTLNDGTTIPQLGFGVLQIPDTAAVTEHALRTGYRHIDTAWKYGNEAEVGQAVRASGLARDDVYITTKLWNEHHGSNRAKEALRESLDSLGMSHVDLYLIHWPKPHQDRYVESWKALVELRDEGLTRSIGVSNFEPSHLERLIDATGVTPAVNQVELHPYFQQAELRRANAELGIVTEAWGPLGRGDAIGDPVIGEIAQAHGRTPAQVIIRWHLQLGTIAIPKSATPERVTANFDVFGFELTDDDLERIAGLERGARKGPHPDAP